MKKLLPILLFITGFVAIALFGQHVLASTPQQDVWLPDGDVTFAGKSVVRAKSFFDWTLQNYQWSGTDSTILADVWGRIRNIVFAMLILVVVGAATAILVTRGKNVGVFEFLKRFFLAIILIIFSFALIRFIYQIADVFQGFFLRNPDGSQLTVNNLLNISFGYDFEGFRRAGDSYTESAFIGILLTKLTAITYNAMAAILLVRKIIMWFFLVVSPLFPLLLLYYPLKNTAKIWLAEFFRWVLYAPLFTLLLSGVVALWRSGILLLPFNLTSTDKYPTAINILLGGPGQVLSLDNSLNTNGTYAQYVVALIMLWIVILLPFLLLRIFLDYLGTISLEGFSGSRATFRLFGNDGLFPQTLSPRAIPSETVKPAETIATTKLAPAPETSRPLSSYGVEGLKTPTLTDIAVFDRRNLSGNGRSNGANVTETLQKIATPERVTPASERAQFSAIRQGLLGGQARGEGTANAILTAAQHTVNNTLTQAPIPTINVVQKVNPKDVEKVRSLWTKNYMSMQPPTDTKRTDWIKKEKEEAERATKLLSSKDPKEVEVGKGLLAHVMAHIVIGGFSLPEILDYLKAKIHAADDVLQELGKQSEEKNPVGNRGGDR